jgi:UDP-sugar transporter A1/2/3
LDLPPRTSHQHDTTNIHNDLLISVNYPSHLWHHAPTTQHVTCHFSDHTIPTYELYVVLANEAKQKSRQADKMSSPRNNSATELVALSSHSSDSNVSLDTIAQEKQRLVNSSEKKPPNSAISANGLKVLILLAVQNCSKNLLLRFVMREHPQFLTSAAVLGVETVKLVLSLLYIQFVEKKPLSSAVEFIKQDRRNTILMAVPATLYSIQMTLEYIALSNLDASVFSVLVQTKLLATAGCAVIILRRSIKKVQLISLVLLTIGVMLCNMKDGTSGAKQDAEMDTTKGIISTLSIAACSGFASVYTEKVIKAKRKINDELPNSQTEPSKKEQYGLAYTQVQLAFVSLVIMGLYCMTVELDVILEKGLWHGFNGPAFVSIFVSAIGGLIVAAVLKFADAVLKGYATAISVVLTGVLSMILFGTHLNVLYFLGIGNVVSEHVVVNNLTMKRNDELTHL